MEATRAASPSGHTDFDWGDVRFFLAVARLGTLTSAASRLGIEHTTVARRIRSLENALKAKLFDRSSSGYRLTREGEIFLSSTETMERAALAAESSVRETDLSLSGCVRIGATDGFATFFLAPRLTLFHRQYRDIDIELLAMPRVFSLSKREADMAIGLKRPEEGRLYSQKLTDYELGVYGSDAYLDSHPPIESVDDLSRHAFISYIDSMIYTQELDYIPRINAAIHARLRISNPNAQLGATLSGYGLCVLPCFIAAQTARLRRVLADKVRLTNSFWLIMHADQHHLARLRAVTRFIQTAIRTDRSIFFGREGAPGALNSPAPPNPA